VRVAFQDNVFVNCPFDETYYPLLRPLLFTIIYLGFTPRLALERADSGEARIEKILELISDSKYGIHDLSRIKAEKAGEFFRLNMPLELGLDIGCCRFGTGQRNDKQCLILETERYRFQAAISDLSNSDIAAHRNEPREVVVQVRNWLGRVSAHHTVGPTKIWASFTDFMAANHDDLTENGFSKKEINALPISELLDRMETWVAAERS
jgi:hypothetical protein